MKVKILIEFEVDSGDQLTEGDAKSAASLAAWDHLCLSETGQSVSDEVTVHVDGFGECSVRVGEDHD